MKVPGYPGRDWLPDILKGWAVIWMILVHCVELFLRKEQADHPIAQFALFMGAVPAAPVFMFLMGYFAGRPGIKPILFLKRGLKLLVFGILLNIGLNLSLLIKWISGQADIQPLTYIFGVDILILAGLSLMIIGLLQTLKPAWYIWIIIAIVFPLLNFFNPMMTPGSNLFTQPSVTDFLIAPIAGSFTWSYFPLIPWLGYVLMGLGIYRLFACHNQYLVKCKYRFYAAIPAGLIFLAGLIPAWRITNDLPAYYHHDLLFFVWALSFIFLLALLALGLKSVHSYSAGPWIRFLGVRVTTVYVIQWLIIGNLATWVFQRLSLTVTLLLFVLILFITLMLTYSYSQYGKRAKT